MSPSDSRELLFPVDHSIEGDAGAPVNLARESSMDWSHLGSITLSDTSSDSDFFQQSSASLREDLHAVKTLAFKDKTTLRGDLKFILTVPEICDVTFLVGRLGVPMYGVKAILCTRSRTFFDMITKHQRGDQKNNRHKNWLLSNIKRILRKDPPNEKSDRLVIEVPEFEPQVFGQILTYIQTGDINVTFADVIGVMNAAEVYCLEGLRSTCLEFARKSITLQSVLPLVLSAQPYMTYKWTKLLLIDVLKFIAENAQDIFRQSEFGLLSQQSAMLILNASGLRATEEAKWEAVLGWTVHNCPEMADSELREILCDLTSNINFCDISVTMLKTEILPLGFLSKAVFNEAISHQTSPRLVVGQEMTKGVKRCSKSKGKGRSIPPSKLSDNFFHLQPLASSTFDSSEDFSDGGFSVGSY